MCASVHLTGESLKGGRYSVSDDTAVDETDIKMMAALRENGRLPVLELARIVGTPESTARKRLNRLLRHGLVRIIGIVSTRALGYQREVQFAIKVAPGQTIHVAKQLAESESVRFVAIGLGAFDVVVNAVFRTDTELFTYINSSLAIDGIVSYQTMELMAVLKRRFDWLVDRELLGNDAAMPVVPGGSANGTHGEEPSSLSRLEA